MKIELTEREAALAAKIEARKENHEPDAWDGVVSAMTELWRSLTQREAIPAARWQFFNDPECYIGGHGRSHRQTVEINNKGPFYTSTAFPRYLHYFIHGPNLPVSVAVALQKRIDDCSPPFNGTDALEVAAYARQLCRSHGLGNRDADEFYKLALDCGLDPDYARTVRDSVKQVR